MKKELTTSEKVKQFLDDIGWIETIHSGEVYETEDDDSETGKGNLLLVQFTPDGDAWINKITDPNFKSIRKRTEIGGGHDYYTRKAIMILAEAMRLDEEKRKTEH